MDCNTLGSSCLILVGGENWGNGYFWSKDGVLFCLHSEGEAEFLFMLHWQAFLINVMNKLFLWKTIEFQI